MPAPRQNQVVDPVANHDWHGNCWVNRMNAASQTPTTPRSPAPFIVLAATALTALTLSWVFIFPQWVTSVEADSVEAAYSALEALFAGLAFLGLLSTIWIQRQELRLQRVSGYKEPRINGEWIRLG